MKSSIVDMPDGERKMQSKPVARLGGVTIILSAIVAGLVIPGLIGVFTTQSAAGVTVLMAWTLAQTNLATALLIFVTIAFLLGLWDDIWTANTKLKLAILLLAALTSAWFGLRPHSLTSPFGHVQIPVLLTIGSALWLLVFTNAANFMDGSNGLSIGCLAIMLSGLALIGSSHGAFDLSVGWFALFGAIGGFLVHNLRSNLYAGDAGALGLGALFASLGLASGLEVWTVATLALPFLVDVLLTLVWRAKHGRSWLSAHRDHAYQRLMDQGWGHLDVAILYWGLSAVCGVGAWIAVQSGGWVSFTLFWVLLVAGCVLWCVNRSTTLLDQSA
ncbi:MAG: hypothetical protein AAF768_08145 [Pseudomonadota bacterium]